MPTKPEIRRCELVAETRIFRVERLHLRFSNGREVEFERLRGSGRGAVLVLPLRQDDMLLLIREYAAGVERYELAFPKGLMERGESPQAAADREIKEEVGYGARELTVLRTLSVAPGYADFQTHVVLARDLYPEQLPGDEPEPVEVVPWPAQQLDELLRQEDFLEARSIAALFLFQRLREEGRLHD
jgi:ADP-ribose diphosphatase